MKSFKNILSRYDLTSDIFFGKPDIMSSYISLETSQLIASLISSKLLLSLIKVLSFCVKLFTSCKI
ncbi:hypothetical protein GW796_00440 [archaeon]|nr:hypothetical protein [archaeon]